MKTLIKPWKGLKREGCRKWKFFDAEVKTLIKPWKGLKQGSGRLHLQSLFRENPNKTLEGIKTADCTPNKSPSASA
ncbi:hypothetical protein U27_01426 [Candidatus Vecturithrix granuli]|uniref:Uncharacterized protein n=1 Tax=Vecturithrix granuli TaxID=1499967 RepID=A0A081CAC0_VECG1|nr:hypothetical protein U27_01426 [Candidatus Vecturithrix granuli]